ncbi:MAG: hypothetical protein K2H89_07130 [Oscillospiraceae bacterium]|nr:hypothetical protein [Oscillospiraceae bacterium]
MFEQDYIMRQIRECVAVTMKLIFKIDMPVPETMVIQNQEKQAKSQELILRIDVDPIKDVLSDLNHITKEKTRDDLLIGFQFYSRIFQKDEDFFDSNQISYSEIREEMKQFFLQYGIFEELFDLIFFG